MASRGWPGTTASSGRTSTATRCPGRSSSTRAPGGRFQPWALHQPEKATDHSLYVGDVMIDTIAARGQAFKMKAPLHFNGKTYDVHNGKEAPPGVPPLAPMTIFTDPDNDWGDG